MSNFPTATSQAVAAAPNAPFDPGSQQQANELERPMQMHNEFQSQQPTQTPPAATPSTTGAGMDPNSNIRLSQDAFSQHPIYGMLPSPFGYSIAPPPGGHPHHQAPYGQIPGYPTMDPYGRQIGQQPQTQQQQTSPQQQQQDMMYGHRMPYPYGGRPDFALYGYNPYGQRDYSQQQQPQQQPPQHDVSQDPYRSKQESDLLNINDDPNNPHNKSKFKKPILQKITSTMGKPNSNKARLVVRDGITIIEDGDQEWYTGCISLGVDDDKYWLSELQVYLRANFAEAFGATEDDIAAPMHGRNKPIALGQVGIRCMHCKNDNPAERGQQATSYPSLISGIYNSVQQMLRLHLDCCLSMPQEVRMKIEQLKVSCSSRGGRKQYWIDSAKRLGLVDTNHGIHFGRDPLGPMPPLTGPSVNSREGRSRKKAPPAKVPVLSTLHEVEAIIPLPPPPPVENRPLVFPEDEALISDFLYLTLEQMAPCYLMEADRVGCYKTRQVGFPGLACRHCVGQAGCGRYFPASESSLSQTTTSQTMMNHVRNCRRCPVEIRENLDIMKRNRVRPDGKRSDKPKHGGRKVFFHRLWCRIQNIPIDEDMSESKSPKRAVRKQSARKRKKDSDDESKDYDGESDHSVSETVGVTALTTRRRRGATRKTIPPWVSGCVRLTKTDDQNWLTEMETFARADLVEVFSHSGEDDLHGYGGRKEPAEGQVGVRCVFCKFLDPAERPNGCVSFPDSLSTISVKVTDMIRLHFPSCPALPDDGRQTFKRHKGFDARSSEDSHNYWEDSARDVGLSNIPPLGTRDRDSWGITFRRDPLEPSPADEFDLDQKDEDNEAADENLLVTEEDRGSCTDQVILLLRQVRPCRFRKSDRRAGSSSRSRDRDFGFPGLCCKHCPAKSNQGRYFPLSAKHLTDTTAQTLTMHVMSCPHCPDTTRASLAYLGHRAILQKAELKGSWKKEFFQKIWDRLHEREWTSQDDEEDPEDDEENDEEDEEDEEGNEDEEEGEESGGQMNALIQAAAIWLTNQDAKDKGGKPKGRALAKRTASSGVAVASAAAADDEVAEEEEDEEEEVNEPEEEESEDDGERMTRSRKRRRSASRK